MRRRYVVAPEPALDLVRIWRYIKRKSSVEMADRVESVIHDKILGLAANPGGGHWRKDLTDEPVKFFSLLLPNRLPAWDEAYPTRSHYPWSSRRERVSEGSFVKNDVPAPSTARIGKKFIMGSPAYEIG